MQLWSVTCKSYIIVIRRLQSGFEANYKRTLVCKQLSITEEISKYTYKHFMKLGERQNILARKLLDTRQHISKLKQ